MCALHIIVGHFRKCFTRRRHADTRTEFEIRTNAPEKSFAPRQGQRVNQYPSPLTFRPTFAKKEMARSFCARPGAGRVALGAATPARRSYFVYYMHGKISPHSHLQSHISHAISIGRRPTRTRRCQSPMPAIEKTVATPPMTRPRPHRGCRVLESPRLIRCKMISINFSNATEHNNHLRDPLHHAQSCFMFIEHSFMVHSSCGRYAHAQIYTWRELPPSHSNIQCILVPKSSLQQCRAAHHIHTHTHAASRASSFTPARSTYAIQAEVYSFACVTRRAA